MDCTSEEQLIRMTLESVPGIRLEFDLPGRTLVVLHPGEAKDIQARLEPLGLGAVVVSQREVEGPDGAGEVRRERGPLLAAFSINAVLFVAEFTAGALAYSLGLIGDSLDMLADAIVYGMALAAVGGSAGRKASIARSTGYFQGFLACTGLAEVVRRAFGGEGMPDFRMMIVVSFIALLGNVATLLILNRSRGTGVHMRAAWICTSVDVQVNALVIAAGAGVYFTASPIPDVLVGGLIFLIVANGARRILLIAK